MAKQNKTLLVGAGAEVVKPFSLLSGKQYIFDTCYFQDERLYEALEDFYRGSLRDKENNAPNTYQRLFLYSPKSAEFKKLAEYLFKNPPQVLSRLMTDRYTEKVEVDGELRSCFNEAGLELLFKMLIKRDCDSEELNLLRENTLEFIPDDAYFGTIETLFPSLINPRSRNQSFWRLINYYWNSFFAIARPLIERAYGKDSLFNQLGIYKFVLSNLEEVVRAITWRGLYRPEEIADTYYGKLYDKFNDVLTTNYTGLSEYLFPDSGEVKRCIYLSGTLWQFEELDSLTSRNILSRSSESVPKPNEFIFPFLMTQAPVKPIIDANQIRAYSRAIEVLDKTNLLVVLGYSFCENDRHIAAMARDYITKSDRQLIYLSYSQSVNSGDIKRLLRIAPDFDCNIRVMGTDEKSLSELEEILDS